MKQASTDAALQLLRSRPQHMRLVCQDVLGQECIVQTPDGVPPVLYRYFHESRHAHDVIESGRIRLGTLYGYLEYEGLTSAQHDQDEGFIIVVDDDLAGVTDAPVSWIVTAADRWTTCLSEELSSDLFDEFEAAAVLEIQTRPFVEAVASEMARFSNIAALDRIRYVESNMRSIRNAPGRDRMAHTYKRREKYERQREWRLCFDPMGSFERSVTYQALFQKFGNRSRYGELGFWKDLRNKGAGGRILSPVFVQSPRIANFVRDVTHLTRPKQPTA